MKKSSKKSRPFQTKHILFAIGLIFALVLTFARSFTYSWAENKWLLLVLLIIGVAIGAMNLKKQSLHFLVAVVALGTMSVADFRMLNNLFPFVGTIIQVFISYLIFFMAPAAVVLAIKEIWVFLNE